MGKKDIPSERPTDPDIAVFPCPNCRDESGAPQGKIFVTKWIGGRHSTKAAPCDVCWGKKEIDRQQMAVWKSRQ